MDRGGRGQRRDHGDSAVTRVAGVALALILHAAPALAWVAQRAAAPGYTGPGDTIAFTAWYGLRAYSAAVAAAGTQPLIRIRNTSTSELCDVLVASNGGMGLTSNCTGAGAGQTVAAFCGGVDCKVHTVYDQVAGNACVGATTCNVVQATAGNQPALSAADSYSAITATGATTVVMTSTNNYAPNAAAKMTLMGVGNISNVASANIFVVAINAINRANIVAGNWVLTGGGAGKTVGGLTESAWHTAVGVMDGSHTNSWMCATASCGTPAASAAPTVLTTPNKFQLVGIVNAATVNKWREGGVKDNYAATSAEASALNGNSSTYWGFTPP